MPKHLAYWRRWCIAVLFLCFCILWWAIHWRPGLTHYPVQGVDVSEINGVISWPTVEAAGADFAYLKATEGADLKDPLFQRNWAETEAAGMRRGAYHLYSLCRPGAEQAANFMSVVPRDATALPAAVRLSLTDNCDERPPRAHVLRQITRFIEMVEPQSGKLLIIALDRDFDATYHISAAIDRPLWLASFFARPGYATRNWAMWQASTFRRVKGIEGATHWNVIQE